MSYTLRMRREADGAEQVVHGSKSWSDDEFWWTEGNGSCDCNRAMYFGDPRACSDDNLYTLVSVTEDGRITSLEKR